VEGRHHWHQPARMHRSLRAVSESPGPPGRRRGCRAGRARRSAAHPALASRRLAAWPGRGAVRRSRSRRGRCGGSACRSPPSGRPGPSRARTRRGWRGRRATRAVALAGRPSGRRLRHA
jgi:hypothetical protein